MTAHHEPARLRFPDEQRPQLATGGEPGPYLDPQSATAPPQATRNTQRGPHQPHRHRRGEHRGRPIQPRPGQHDRGSRGPGRTRVADVVGKPRDGPHRIAQPGGEVMPRQRSRQRGPAPHHPANSNTDGERRPAQHLHRGPTHQCRRSRSRFSHAPDDERPMLLTTRARPEPRDCGRERATRRPSSQPVRRVHSRYHTRAPPAARVASNTRTAT